MRLALPGVTMHLRADGPQDAPPLMLLHSLGTDHWVWQPQAAALAGRFWVLRPDLRGHGASDVPPGPYAIAEMARDVLAALAALGIERLPIAGLSTGGMVAQCLAALAPQRVAALVTNFATRMQRFGVRPEIEIFDLSHIHGAARLVEAGLIDERPHVQFVMGVKNALPAEERLLDILLGELRRVLPKATWTAAGIGANQARVMEWALARSADGVRTGLEDNIRVSKERLAASNAELARHARRAATPVEARALLGLAAA
ncbi:hypothetical protein DFH01_17165 [Falsiroseomonas bella]|uniref:Uncharacterized protein n=1 Tax=Falsiroseomonas bella TaxID=2184016 RepID=A0A317FD78_9PROT|nr:alpha/beta fold hydrolase [Falsiroseomonas bella]PWS35987.1 hypothetical protein DFH01_17165 [Falsiroseomonas bella]